MICCNVDDRLTGFLIKELGLIPKKNTFDRLTSINCNSIMLQHMAASRLWRGVLFPSAVPQIKIVGWAYFSISFCPQLRIFSWSTISKMFLQFSLQVDECEAKSDEDSYICTSCCRFATFSHHTATTNIQMPPKISKCHHKYPNDTKKNQMTPKITKNVQVSASKISKNVIQKLIFLE